jgi:hypothetical protein
MLSGYLRFYDFGEYPDPRLGHSLDFALECEQFAYACASSLNRFFD